MFPLHQRAITDPFGYDPKSEVLETTVLSVYTTDLEKANKNTASPVRKAVQFCRYGGHPGDPIHPSGLFPLIQA